MVVPISARRRRAPHSLRSAPRLDQTSAARQLEVSARTPEPGKLLRIVKIYRQRNLRTKQTRSLEGRGNENCVASLVNIKETLAKFPRVRRTHGPCSQRFVCFRSVRFAFTRCGAFRYGNGTKDESAEGSRCGERGSSGVRCVSSPARKS